jgi:hypothetical protein
VASVRGTGHAVEGESDDHNILGILGVAVVDKCQNSHIVAAVHDEVEVHDVEGEAHESEEGIHVHTDLVDTAVLVLAIE